MTKTIFDKLTDNSLFPLGKLYTTPGAIDALQEAYTWDAKGQAVQLLMRHSEGDWGQIDKSDKGLNEKALKEGTRIFSVYDIPQSRLWIITEADRSSTTILLPSEY